MFSEKWGKLYRMLLQKTTTTKNISFNHNSPISIGLYHLGDLTPTGFNSSIAQGFPISVSLQLMTLDSPVWECFCLRPVIASLEQKYIKGKAESNPTWYIWYMGTRQLKTSGFNLIGFQESKNFRNSNNFHRRSPEGQIAETFCSHHFYYSVSIHLTNLYWALLMC